MHITTWCQLPVEINWSSVLPSATTGIRPPLLRKMLSVRVAGRKSGLFWRGLYTLLGPPPPPPSAQALRFECALIWLTLEFFFYFFFVGRDIDTIYESERVRE